MGLLDNIIGGLKDATNSEIARKVNDTVNELKGKVNSQIDTHVGAQMDNLKDKVTNASVELVMKKFLLTLI